MRFVQVMAGVLALFALLNFFLMVFGKLNPPVFWINTAVLAAIAFWIVPFLGRRLGGKK